jgi:hypothetical protein
LKKNCIKFWIKRLDFTVVGRQNHLAEHDHNKGKDMTISGVGTSMFSDSVSFGVVAGGLTGAATGAAIAMTIVARDRFDSYRRNVAPNMPTNLASLVGSAVLIVAWGTMAGISIGALAGCVHSLAIGRF